jgi:hypothetical protein
MIKSIKTSVEQWDQLKEMIKKDHGNTFFLIKSKALNLYGFSVRYHHYYLNELEYQEDIYLDFYDESKKILFLLKYGENL